VIEHFSRRRAEIVEQLELVGSHSLDAGNVAALETRKRKDHSVPIGRLRDEWRARAAEHGLTRQDVEYLLTRRFQSKAVPREVDLDELTKHAATFARRDVLQAIAEAHHDGARTVDELEAKADEILDSREIVRIPDPAEARYTTETQLRIERGLLDSARSRRDKDVAVAEPLATERALATRSLSDEQAHAVRQLTSSGHGVEVVRAPAGTGKTFALDAAREAWERSGQEVVGCALSAQAARELREHAGIETTTIADLKNRLDRGYRLPQAGVLIVDEAGMVGTRDLAVLDVWAQHTNTKLLLVGDDKQLPEIEAGGAFRAIAEHDGAVELSQVRRQDREWDRQALSALREGRTADWAAAYVDHGRVKTAETRARRPGSACRRLVDGHADRDRCPDDRAAPLRCHRPQRPWARPDAGRRPPRTRCRLRRQDLRERRRGRRDQEQRGARRDQRRPCRGSRRRRHPPRREARSG
jgi:hypothetical protein